MTSQHRDGGATVQRAFTARDLATLNRISDPQLSPDGRWLAFVVQSADWEGNSGFNRVWILDMRVPAVAPRQLEISDKPAWHPRWSNDGQRLYFLAARSGPPQVWRTDEVGVDATQVTDLPVAVEHFRLSPDSQALVLALTVPDTFPRSEPSIDQAKSKTEVSSALIVDRAPARVWDSWKTGARTQLFSLRLTKDPLGVNDLVPLMAEVDCQLPERPIGNDSDYAVSSEDVIFSALPPGERWGASNRYKLYRVPLDGSGSAEEIERQGPSDSRNTKPTLSPDGSQLAFLRKRAGSEEMRAAIMLRELAGGTEIELCPNLDRSADALSWARASRTLLATVPDRGNVRLYEIDIQSRTASALTDSGEVTSPTSAANETVVVRSSLGAPAELYAITSNDDRQLTSVNADRVASVALSNYEQFSFAGWNGETVYGYVTQPHGFVAGRKYPVALLIHGGPYASFGDIWHYRWNPQVIAGMGFGVVTIDFHGSAGYGEAFGKAIVNHWGDRPLEDLQKGWAAALAAYDYLDGDRACALGGSYGGYMVAWLAGVWNDPWRCFVIHNGIVDVRSWALTGDVLAFAEYEFGGLPWDNPAEYEQFNPLTMGGKWRKPVLVIAGGVDYRVPISQALTAFSIAQRTGVDSKLLVYPDENHFVLKPRNLVDWYANIEAWMRRWT